PRAGDAEGQAPGEPAPEAREHPTVAAVRSPAAHRVPSDRATRDDSPGSSQNPALSRAPPWWRAACTLPSATDAWTDRARGAGVAHEINNPLSFVLGNLNFVFAELEQLPSLANTEILDALEEAVTGANRVKNIVADLRRLSHGGDEQQQGAVQLQTVAELSGR